MRLLPVAFMASMIPNKKKTHEYVRIEETYAACTLPLSCLSPSVSEE